MNTLKLIPVLLMFITLGCSEDHLPNCKVASVNGDPKNVLGIWQLVSSRLFDQETGKETFTDYSCDNIYLIFQDNGNYVMKGSSPMIPNISNHTFEFKYGEKLDEFGNSSIRISHFNYPCLLEKDKMTWNSSYVDGGTYVFYRVKDIID